MNKCTHTKNLNIQWIEQQDHTDFKDSILNNTNALSGIITGAEAAYAVEMGIQAMDTNKVTYWDNINL